MTVEAKIEKFLALLKSLHFEQSFNPYTNLDEDHDLPNAPAIRCRNLRTVLIAASRRPVDELWLALEPTRLGARRTGLAMTDEQALALCEDRWNVSLTKATATTTARERTARKVWEALQTRSERIFLWNVVPVHTYDQLDGSDRNHRRGERRGCLSQLKALFDIVRPRYCLAFGENVLPALGSLVATYVKHPARSGGEFDRILDQLHAAGLNEVPDLWSFGPSGVPRLPPQAARLTDLEGRSKNKKGVERS